MIRRLLGWEQPQERPSDDVTAELKPKQQLAVRDGFERAAPSSLRGGGANEAIQKSRALVAQLKNGTLVNGSIEDSRAGLLAHKALLQQHADKERQIQSQEQVNYDRAHTQRLAISTEPDPQTFLNDTSKTYDQTEPYLQAWDREQQAALAKKASLERAQPIQDQIAELDKAIFLTQRMEYVLNAKQLTEKIREPNKQRNEIRKQLQKLKSIQTDQDAIVAHQGTLQAARDRIAELTKQEAGLTRQIEDLNKQFTQNIDALKTFDETLGSQLPEDTWGQTLWENASKLLGLPVGLRLGREDVSDLVSEKLMADAGVTLQGAYQALAQKLTATSTGGIRELLEMMMGLPQWALQNPYLASAVWADIQHALAILRERPEAAQYQQALAGLQARMRATNLLRAVDATKDQGGIPGEVFALIDMAKKAPYVARFAQAGETTLGTLMRRTGAWAAGGEGYASQSAGVLGDFLQSIVRTNAEKIVAQKAAHLEPYLDSALKLYREEDWVEVAKQHLKKQCAQQIVDALAQVYNHRVTIAKQLKKAKEAPAGSGFAALGRKIWGAKPVVQETPRFLSGVPLLEQTARNLRMDPAALEKQLLTEAGRELGETLDASKLRETAEQQIAARRTKKVAEVMGRKKVHADDEASNVQQEMTEFEAALFEEGSDDKNPPLWRDEVSARIRG